MYISSLISKSSVISDLHGRNKDEVLTVLAAAFGEVVPGVAAQEILEIFQEREQLGSTGIGKGIAIPHGRVKGLKKPVAVLGRSAEGVAFAATDGKPVHLIIALLSPDGTVKPHLKALSCISHILNQAPRRKQLLAAADQESLYNALIMEEGEG